MNSGQTIDDHQRFPKPYWHPLFQHMHDEHGLVLLESECHEIARIVDECRRRQEEASVETAGEPTSTPSKEMSHHTPPPARAQAEQEPDLFDIAQRRSQKRTRTTQIIDNFERFHRDNPDIWKLFQRFAFEAIDHGLSHYSASAIFERIRWHVAVTTRGGDVKLSNNFRAYYARLFHLAHPAHSSFFRNRKLRSEDRAPDRDGNPPVVPQDADDDPETEARLADILRDTQTPTTTTP